MAAILFVAISVALVGGAVVFLRGGLLAGCLVVLVAGTCFGHPFFNLPAGPVPLTVDRVLWIVLLVQCLLWRRMGRADPKPLGNAEIVLMAFFALLALSTFSHDWRANHSQPAARLLFYYLMPLGVYWVARQIPLRGRTAAALFAGLGGFGVYLALTGLAEAHGQSWLVYPRYIGATTEAEFLGRARGPLLNPAGSGLLQALCLGGALLWWPRLNRRGRAVLVAVATLISLGIFSTYTRSVWLGAGVGLFVLLALTLPRSWRLPVLGGILLCAAVAGAAKWEEILAFKRDRDLDVRESVESVKLRPILAVVAWNMFRDRPLLGCGFGHYEDEQVNYLDDRSTGLPLEKARPFTQHNVFLAILVETGLVGLGLYVALLGLWTRDAWRVWRSAAAPPWARQMVLLFLVLLSNYLTIGMFQDTALIPMVNMVLFFMAGITAGLRQYGCPAGATAPLASSSSSLPRCSVGTRGGSVAGNLAKGRDPAAGPQPVG